MNGFRKLCFLLLLDIFAFICWGQTKQSYNSPQMCFLLDSSKPLNLQISSIIQNYEIQDEIDLKGETITIPNSCYFHFNGGKIKNGTIIGDCLLLDSWGFDNVKLYCNIDFTTPIMVPIDNPKEFVATILEYKPIISDRPTVFVFSANQVYKWDGELNVNKKNVTLTGGGTIEGHIHIGFDADTFKNNKFDSYPATSHSNIIVSDLRFSKYTIIGSLDDSKKIRQYIIDATPTIENTAISIINSSNVKIENCFFDNVPYPVVYTPNNQYVNQNVRRLNIVNCDFEMCHTAVYAPSIIKNADEYGDLIFSNNNVFPTNSGIDVSCIDGLKVFNNTFNTCLKNQNGANIVAYFPGQVVITNNSFYGEYNGEAVILDSPGTAIIDGNLFSAQGTENPPIDQENIACLHVLRSNKTRYTNGLAITNNLFSDVNRLPIYADGYFRSATIMGNTVSCTHYTSNKRTIYYFNSLCRDEVNVQPMRMNDNLLEDVTGTLNLRMEAINDLMNSNSLYPNEIWDRNKHIYTIKNGNNYIPVSVIGCSKTKPIYVVCPIQSSYTGDVPFIFNGIHYSISVDATTTEAQVLENIIKALRPKFEDTHEFKIIDNTLWIVGKNSNIPVITPMWEINEKTSPFRFEVLYQNLGYNIIIKDIDGKNFVGTPLYNYGIDSKDNGKIVRFGDILTVLSTNQTSKRAQLVFGERPQKLGSYKWLYNDMFFASGVGGTANTNQLLTSIVALCYADRAVVNDNTLELKEVGREYNFKTSGDTWYSTYNNHVVDYRFMTSCGIEYYPDKNSYNNFGVSSSRPSSPPIGFQYFDTTLGIPVFWDGKQWVDSESNKR